MNIFRDMKTENLIFKDERVFMADYMPDEIVGREREIREIADALKTVERKARAPSMIISGPPGTGKTCCTRFVLGQLQEYTQRAIVAYINCWQNSTRYAVLTRVLEAIDKTAPQSGMAVDRLIDKIGAELKNSEKSAIVVLDEADALTQEKGEGSAVLYDLLRSAETTGARISVIAIANNPEFVIEFDKRVRSSFAQMGITFRPYSPGEMKRILMERAKTGLHTGTYDDEIVGKCAAFAGKNGGDARIGITMLWLSGREAEAKNAAKITTEDVEASKQHISAVAGGGKAEPDQSKWGSQILKLLEQGEMESGEIYEKLGLAERTGRRYLERMEANGLIESNKAEGKRGNVRMFRVKTKK